MAEVAKCPNCGKPIDATHENSWCIKCGSPLPEDIRGRLPRLVAAATAAAASDAAVARTQSGSPVVNRYRDAYRAGAALVGFGNTIKRNGVILFGLIVVASLSYGDGPFARAGVMLGAAVSLLFWVCGVMVAAQGQILRATLDKRGGIVTFSDRSGTCRCDGLAAHPVAVDC